MNQILANKAFKSDSQRAAFLLRIAFSVSGGMRQHRYCVAQTLYAALYQHYLKNRYWPIAAKPKKRAHDLS